MDDLILEINSIFEKNLSLQTNLNQVSSIIFYGMKDISWAGFYIVNGDKQRLELSAFVGRVACTFIKYDKGVVGHCYSTNSVVIVDDVHAFEGHIACDSRSKSEVCIPINYDGVYAVLDLDSEVEGRFKGMETEMKTLGNVLSDLVQEYYK